MVISGCWFASGHFGPSNDYAFFVILYGAGLVYGLATLWFMFTVWYKRLSWLVISGISYLIAVRFMFTFDTPEPHEFIIKGILGALIVSVGYSVLQRECAISRIVSGVVLGGVIAGLIGSLFMIGSAGVFFFALLWPVWQVAVTYALLRGRNSEQNEMRSAA